MEKFRGFIDYWTQLFHLTEAQFFALITRFYQHFFVDDNEH